MSISVVFDPLHIRQLQDSLDVETLTQPQIRVLVEEYRDRLLSPTLCVHSAKTRSYLQQFLPDLWARAKVEELLPAYLARTELDIKIGEVVNEVVHSREEWQAIVEALRNSSLRETWSDVETMDFLLRVYYNIPEGTLSVGEEYYALTQIDKVEHPRLLQRLRERIRSDLAALSRTSDLQDLRLLLLVNAVAAEGGKPIPQRAILGERAQQSTLVPPKRWEEIFRYLVTRRRSFLKQELEITNLVPHQQETLLEFMDLPKDTIFKAALQRKIERNHQIIEQGGSVSSADLETLRHHLFADEACGDIDALHFSAQAQKVIEEANNLPEPANWNEWRNFFVEKVASLLEAREKLERQGVKIPPQILERLAALLEGIDKVIAKALASEYETILQQYPQETVLDFANALRRAMSTSNRIVVLFIDALSFDLWLYLRELLEALGLAFEESSRLSLLPTATRYTKHSLFLGHVEKGFEPDREELARSLNISESDIRFERVADRLQPNVLKSLVAEEWRVLILSFNTLDERLKSPLASGDLLKAIDDLSEKWKLLIDETKRLNIPLAVVSDHGFREVSGASTVPIAYAVSPEFVRWTLRERSSSEELPEGCIQIGDYLLAVGSHVLRPTSRRYEHGGVSLRELVVPLAIGRPMRTLRAPDIELIDNQVIEQESGKLRFAIKNPNDVDLTLDLSLTPDNLRLDNLYLPPISGLHISARQSQEVAFTLRVSKIEDFTKDARANSAQRKIRLDCSYCAPATSVASKPFQFSVSVKKNIRVTDRGAIEKELEELGI